MALGVVFSAELVVAEEGTRFQVTETPRGLSGVRYASLMRLRGNGSFALEAALTGAFFTAEQAFAAGLVNRVAPRGAYLEAAYELAKEIATMPPLSVRAMVRARRLEIEKAEREAAVLTDPLKLHLTEDFAESARAFAEKRPARPMQGR
jgi:enoyl-CoA hydratase/carnithine racemase